MVLVVVWYIFDPCTKIPHYAPAFCRFPTRTMETVKSEIWEFVAPGDMTVTASCTTFNNISVDIFDPEVESMCFADVCKINNDYSIDS